MTSRIDGTPARSMASRSIPMPRPPQGGKPVLEGQEVVLVDRLGLLVAAGGQRRLGLEAARAGRPGR